MSNTIDKSRVPSNIKVVVITTNVLEKILAHRRKLKTGDKENKPNVLGAESMFEPIEFEYLVKWKV
jgi:hypothetical protein